MRYADIQHGAVVNVVLAGADFAEEHGLVPCDETVEIGDLWDGATFQPAPAEPAPVPATVTHRQGMAVLIKYGLDTQVDAALNAQLSAAVNGGDAQATIAAKLAINDWQRSTEFHRQWPLIKQMQQVFGWSDAFVDGLFIEAAGL